MEDHAGEIRGLCLWSRCDCQQYVRQETSHFCGNCGHSPHEHQTTYWTRCLTCECKAFKQCGSVVNECYTCLHPRRQHASPEAVRNETLPFERVAAEGRSNSCSSTSDVEISPRNSHKNAADLSVSAALQTPAIHPSPEHTSRWTHAAHAENAPVLNLTKNDKAPVCSAHLESQAGNGMAACAKESSTGSVNSPPDPGRDSANENVSGESSQSPRKSAATEQNSQHIHHEGGSVPDSPNSKAVPVYVISDDDDGGEKEEEKENKEKDIKEEVVEEEAEEEEDIDAPASLAADGDPPFGHDGHSMTTMSCAGLSVDVSFSPVDQEQPSLHGPTPAICSQQEYSLPSLTTGANSVTSAEGSDAVDRQSTESRQNGSSNKRRRDPLVGNGTSDVGHSWSSELNSDCAVTLQDSSGIKEKRLVALKKLSVSLSKKPKMPNSQDVETSGDLSFTALPLSIVSPATESDAYHADCSSSIPTEQSHQDTTTTGSEFSDPTRHFQCPESALENSQCSSLHSSSTTTCTCDPPTTIRRLERSIDHHGNGCPSKQPIRKSAGARKKRRANHDIRSKLTKGSKPCSPTSTLISGAESTTACSNPKPTSQEEQSASDGGLDYREDSLTPVVTFSSFGTDSLEDSMENSLQANGNHVAESSGGRGTEATDVDRDARSGAPAAYPRAIQLSRSEDTSVNGESTPHLNGKETLADIESDNRQRMAAGPSQAAAMPGSYSSPAQKMGSCGWSSSSREFSFQDHSQSENAMSSGSLESDLSHPLYGAAIFESQEERNEGVASNDPFFASGGLEDIDAPPDSPLLFAGVASSYSPVDSNLTRLNENHEMGSGSSSRDTRPIATNIAGNDAIVLTERVKRKRKKEKDITSSGVADRTTSPDQNDPCLHLKFTPEQCPDVADQSGNLSQTEIPQVVIHVSTSFDDEETQAGDVPENPSTRWQGPAKSSVSVAVNQLRKNNPTVLAASQLKKRKKRKRICVKI